MTGGFRIDHFDIWAMSSSPYGWSETVRENSTKKEVDQMATKSVDHLFYFKGFKQEPFLSK